MSDVVEITAEIEGYEHPRARRPAPEWAQVFDLAWAKAEHKYDPMLQLERARLLNVLIQAGKKFVFIDLTPMVEGKTIHTFIVLKHSVEARRIITRPFNPFDL